MPGPCSAPNGDRSLVHGECNLCPVHGRVTKSCYDENMDKRSSCKRLVTLREYKAQRGQLISGKTKRSRGL